MNILSTKRIVSKASDLSINEIYNYDKISDEMLYNNLENYKELINKQLKICFNPSCTDLRCKNICMIYTNPKVGCTTLWSSLNLYFSDFLTTNRWHNEYPLESRGILDISINQFLEVNNMHDKNVIVIDIYRPIFDMCQSFFFLYFIALVDEIYQNDIDYIINAFNRFFFSIYNHMNIDYYKEVYNLNTTFNVFNFNEKHLFFRNKNIKYIKLRLLDTNEWNPILSSVLNTNFKIITDNKTENKETGKMYNEFKKKYKIPKNYYDIIKNNKHFLFYYTTEEQDTYLKKFDGKITDNYTGPVSDIGFIYPNYTNIPNDKLPKTNKEGKNINYLINKANEPTFSNCNCESCKLVRKEFISNQ
jgi:hypothetical protein